MIAIIKIDEMIVVRIMCLYLIKYKEINLIKFIYTLYEEFNHMEFI